jgi:hypothetical protein
VFFLFSDLFLSCLTFALLERTFCSQGVNLGLTVSSFLLHGSKTRDLHLFFLLDALLLGGFGSFSGSFICIVLDDLLFFVNFFLAGLLFLLKCNFVGSLNLGDHFQIAYALLLCCFDLCKSHGLDLTSHLFLFFSKKFTLTDAFLLTLLNLVDDDKCAFALLLLANNLTFFCDFETLQALNLHEQVKLFLLFNPLTFEHLVFLGLLVADGYNLGVQNHLVHVLNIV